eukprot:TRINITY_DN45679_c0_g1_i1.p1 TRINITY_DN45679_c0_g1~~TRINITY_DN45679_c0_g1_i1.p1  ORF type:complete len:464 (+),score=61.66 TRINITY_DN45679_c0_g1_i1:59-1393(+)
MFFASFCYGTYQVPVKKHETHDGIVYIWYQCTGALIGGIVFACFRNDWLARPGNSSGFYVCPEGILCGMIYVLASVCAIQSIKNFGLANYYSFHEVTNLAGAFIVGVFGNDIGIPSPPPSNIGLAAAGILCVMIGTIPLAKMKPASEEAAALSLALDAGRDRSAACRPPAAALPAAAPLRSLDDLFAPPTPEEEARASAEPSAPTRARPFSVAIPEFEAPEASSRQRSNLERNAHTWDGGGFWRRQDADTVPESFNHHIFCGATVPVSLISSDVEDDCPEVNRTIARPWFSKWFSGLIYALFAGVLFSVQYAPQLFWNHRMDGDVSPFDFVFSMSMGVYVSATAVLLTTGFWKRVHRQPMQKSVMRPALLAGVVWIFGTVNQLYCNHVMSYTIAFCGIVGGGLVTSLCWGVCCFGEAPGSHNKRCVAASFACVFTGVMLLALSK